MKSSRCCGLVAPVGLSPPTSTSATRSGDGARKATVRGQTSAAYHAQELEGKQSALSGQIGHFAMRGDPQRVPGFPVAATLL